MRSTKKKDRRQAMAVAVAWENAADKARAGELTQAASVKILNQLMEASTGESLKVRSNERVMQDFLASRTIMGRASSTSARYKPILDGFVESLGDARRRASVSSLTPAEIERWRDAEVADGKSAKTVNMGVGVVRAALEASKRRGEILANPADAVEAVAGRSEEREPFTGDDIAALLRVARDKYADWKTAILVGALTGLRLGDVAALTWGQINLADGYLTTTPDKTENPVSVALAPQLRAHFGELGQGGQDQPIMPSLHGRKTGSNGGNAGLSNEFNRLMALAGVVGRQGRVKVGKGRRIKSKSFHSLRHTFTTSVAASGAGDAVTKSMTGHTTDEAFRRYIHLGVDAQRKALDALGWLGDKTRDIIGHDSAEVSRHYTHVDEESKGTAIDLLPDITKDEETVNAAKKKGERGKKK